MSFLLLRKIPKNQSSFAVGGLRGPRSEACKKKLNLLWNLKFNFFSVAERPLTFFAYFLNAKKVGRRRLVIVPATAGGLPLFPHAASVPAPALAPVRSHFTPRPPPCAVVRFAAMASPPRTSILPSPSRLCRRRVPNGKNPGPLLPFGRISPAAKPGWPVVAPAGGNVLATPFSLCSNLAPHIPAGSAGVRSLFHGSPRARIPALVGLRLRFACGEDRRVRLPAPPFGFAAQNQARHFAARNHPVRLSASRP